MRDPKRIARMCQLFKVIWENFPDWRMGQLVSNLQGPGPHDVFHLEDDEMEELMIAELERLKVRGR